MLNVDYKRAIVNKANKITQGAAGCFDELDIKTDCPCVYFKILI